MAVSIAVALFLILCCGSASAFCKGYNNYCNDEETYGMCQRAQAVIDAYHERVMALNQTPAATVALEVARPQLRCAQSVVCGYVSITTYIGCQNGDAYEKCTNAATQLAAYVAVAENVVVLSPSLLAAAANLPSSWQCTRRTSNFVYDYYAKNGSAQRGTASPSSVLTYGIVCMAVLLVGLQSW